MSRYSQLFSHLCCNPLPSPADSQTAQQDLGSVQMAACYDNLTASFVSVHACRTIKTDKWTLNPHSCPLISSPPKDILKWHFATSLSTISTIRRRPLQNRTIWVGYGERMVFQHCHSIEILTSYNLWTSILCSPEVSSKCLATQLGRFSITIDLENTYLFFTLHFFLGLAIRPMTTGRPTHPLSRPPCCQVRKELQCEWHGAVSV